MMKLAEPIQYYCIMLTHWGEGDKRGRSKENINSQRGLRVKKKLRHKVHPTLPVPITFILSVILLIYLNRIISFYIFS